MPMKNKVISILAGLSLTVFVAQLLLVLVSWLLAAARPDWHVNSMLSSEGIRWFFRNLTTMLSSPVLIWIVLCAMAYGSVRSSGLARALTNFGTLSSRERFAVIVVFVEFVLAALVLVLLTCIPHAILLSSVGTLFPSSFSASIVPVVAIIVIVMGITYGSLCQQTGLVDIYKIMYNGIAYIVPLIPLYMLVVLFINSLFYVFIL